MDGRNDLVGLNRATGYGYDWSFNGHGILRGPAWNADDDYVTKGAAVFFQEILSTASVNGGFRATLHAMTTADGQTQTIAFSENLEATTWGSTHVSEMAFIVPVQGIPLSWGPTVADMTFDNGMGPDALIGGPRSEAMIYDPARLLYDTFPLDIGRINSYLGAAAEGLTPRPSSFHPGTVNALFADGHAQNVNQTIDMSVYLRLVTPRGERHGQVILSDSDY